MAADKRTALCYNKNKIPRGGNLVLKQKKTPLYLLPFSSQLLSFKMDFLFLPKLDKQHLP